MEQSLFLRQSGIADPSKFKDKRVAVDRGLTITAHWEQSP